MLEFEMWDKVRLTKAIRKEFSDDLFSVNAQMARAVFGKNFKGVGYVDKVEPPVFRLQNSLVWVTNGIDRVALFANKLEPANKRHHFKRLMKSIRGPVSIFTRDLEKNGVAVAIAGTWTIKKDVNSWHGEAFISHHLTLRPPDVITSLM